MSSCQHCLKCGTLLEKKWLEIENHERLVCPDCGFIFYQNPIPAVGVILQRDSQICLVKRKFEPRAGFWCLPAGFVEMNESVEDAAIREAKEETNLDIEIESLEGVYSAFDSPKLHVIVIFYHCKIVGGALRAGDDALEVDFYPLSQLPEPLAFNAHTTVVEKLKREMSSQ